MRDEFAIVVLSLIASVGVCETHKTQEPFPSGIVIARDSFIDIGPPFNYYDLTFLHVDGNKTEVERISLTPPADTCYPHAEIRTFHLNLDESLSDVLAGTNPCSIPEKKLKAESKRRSKGLVFSGMVVRMQVECSGRTRSIRSEILDRDIFDKHPSTPQYTAWSRALFDRLDQLIGDHPWDKPIFPISDAAPSSDPLLQSRALQAVADGKFDQIFGEQADHPSELYRSAQAPIRHPNIELVSSEPIRPDVYVDPIYPPIAKAARVQGTVEFQLAVDANGLAMDSVIDAGPPMLRQAVTNAIAKWKFSTKDSGKAIHGSIRFAMNCQGESK